MSREWTGSCSRLDEAMRELAIKFAERGSGNGELSDVQEFLRDEAYTLNEWADAVAQLYARLDAGEPYTNAQGVAITRRITERTSRVVIFPRQPDLPDGYLGAFYEDVDGNGFTCGIAQDGQVSS